MQYQASSGSSPWRMPDSGTPVGVMHQEQELSKSNGVILASSNRLEIADRHGAWRFVAAALGKRQAASRAATNSMAVPFNDQGSRAFSSSHIGGVTSIAIEASVHVFAKNVRSVHGVRDNVCGRS